MISITMKQAETFKTLLTKANKGTHWLENKMAKVTTAAPAKAPAKKAVKKKVATAPSKKVTTKKGKK